MLLGYWPKMRGGDLLFSVYWLYNRTRRGVAARAGREGPPEHGRLDERRHQLAQRQHGPGIRRSRRPTTCSPAHPSTWQASYRNYDKIREMYGQVPGGMFGGDENCRPGFTDPRQAVETCGMVEMMLSTETLTWITGDLLWADRCEDVAFNSLPAALTGGLQGAPLPDRAPTWCSRIGTTRVPGCRTADRCCYMNPHLHRCCQHNWGHGWPYYAEHLWFATPDNGLAAVFFSECQVTAKVGRWHGGDDRSADALPVRRAGRASRCRSEAAGRPSRCTCAIPGWCARPEVADQRAARQVEARPHAVMCASSVTWSDGDQLELSLPMEITLRRWQQNHNSVSVDRGPLTYSLKIGEQYVRAGRDGRVARLGDPSRRHRGITGWCWRTPPAASFEVIQRLSWPTGRHAFRSRQSPDPDCEPKASGFPNGLRTHSDWSARCSPAPSAPKQPNEIDHADPDGRGAAANQFLSGDRRGSGRPTAGRSHPALYRATASHCWTSDTVDAVADGTRTEGLRDASIPRLTWWDHRGTEEWIQAEFEQSRTVDRGERLLVRRYRGRSCRLPAGWRLEYRQGDRWQAVDGSPLPSAATNTTRSSSRAVPTRALRLIVQLQPGFSGGILEWQVHSPD